MNLLPIIRRARRPLLPGEDVRPAEPPLKTTAPGSEETPAPDPSEADIKPEEPDAG